MSNFIADLRYYANRLHEGNEHIAEIRLKLHNEPFVALTDEEMATLRDHLISQWAYVDNLRSVLRKDADTPKVRRWWNRCK